MNKIITGDSLDVLKTLEDNSIDSIVTDPPYGYSFMGKSWDKTLPDIGIFKECFRVLKPGAFAFVMSAPRSDVCARMMLMLEDAGFDICYTPIYHTYASGFPKALNVHKKLTKDAETSKHQLLEVLRTSLHSATPHGKDKHGAYVSSVLAALESGAQCEILTDHRPRQEVQVSKGGAEPSLEGRTDVSSAQRELCVCEICALPVRLRVNGAEGWLCHGAQAGNGAITWTLTDARGERTSFQSQPVGQPTKQLEAICDQCRTQEVGALAGAYGGFNPKPAVEVVIVASKPGDCKTFSEQALKNQKGITWLDDCRVPTNENLQAVVAGVSKAWRESEGRTDINTEKRLMGSAPGAGRFPANLLVSDEVLDDHSRFFSLDEWAQTLPFLAVPKASKREKNEGLDCIVSITIIDEWDEEAKPVQLQVVMGNSRLKVTVVSGIQNKNVYEWSMSLFGSEHMDVPFLLNTKSITLTETNSITPQIILSYLTGLLTSGRIAGASLEMGNGGNLADGVESYSLSVNITNEKTELAPDANPAQSSKRYKISVKEGSNIHSTVKPLKLMSYLITLGSRPGDTILDPFVGSGTTCIAAKQLGRQYIGIEREAEYVKIAEARLSTPRTT